MFSCRDLLFHFILNILPQNIILLCSKSFISSVLPPSSTLQNFLFFSPLGEYVLRGNHRTNFSYRQCLNTKEIAEHFIHQEQPGKNIAGFDSAIDKRTQRSTR